MLIPYQQLSEEQKGVIRRISRETGNLFIEGPAGSGKTLISLYTIANIVENSTVKPLFIIYNHSLFGFLSSALKEMGIMDNITIVTKDKFFWDKASNEFNIRPLDHNKPFEDKHTFILQNLIKQDLKNDWEVAIVDEVQDITKIEWEVINKISKRVLAFGDFDQGVYKTDLSKSYITNSFYFDELTEIKRFHVNIAKLAQVFSKTKKNLERLVSKDSSVQPKLIDTQLSNRYQKIIEILRETRAFRQTIGIICPDRDELRKLSDYLKSNQFEHHYYESNRDLRTHDFTSTEPLLITSFSSKGLEFEHVILFGFEKDNEKVKNLISTDKLKDVIYVSITRTNSHLYILRTPETVQELKDLVIASSNSSDLESIDDLF
jgi:DNA helicase IV